MTTTGGLRQRLIVDSTFKMVSGCLAQLGWMDETVWHRPVIMLTDAVDEEDEVKFNTVAVSDEAIVPEPLEMGGSGTRDSIAVWFDIYAENATVGKSLAKDIRDILAGLHPDVGRTQAGLLVFDWRLATPVPLFSCDIEKADFLRAKTFPKPWAKFYWVVRCDLIDEYNAA